jgi:hypothetical protein
VEIVYEPSSITVLAPQTGTIADKDEDDVATVVPVSWRPLHYCGSQVDVELHRTSTGPPTKIADLVTGQAQTNNIINSYGWTVPDVPTGDYVEASDYFIRVTDNSATPITDDGGEFSLFDTDGVTPPPTPAIDIDNTPLAGKTFNPLDYLEIAWTETWGNDTSNLGTSVEVVLRSDAGLGPDVVLESGLALGTGYKRWQITNYPSGSTNGINWSGEENYWIEVYSTNGVVTATSSKFTINPLQVAKELRITKPVGGSAFFIDGPPVEIEWDDVNGNISGTVKIECWSKNINTGDTGSRIAQIDTNVAVTDGHYSWAIPYLIYIAGYRAGYIKVSSETDNDVQPAWSGRFTINLSSESAVFVPVWSREDEEHAIYRADTSEGTNNIPEKFVAWAQTAGIEDANGYAAGNGGTTFPTVREMITDKDQNLAVAWMDADDAGVGTQVFAGAGLNDATSGGTYSGTGPTTFDVEIDATGTPDTFKWRKGAAAYTTGVAITGAAQTLSDGVTVTFAATTGHTLADKWAWDVADKFPRARVGDTGRIKLYDNVGGDEIWAADCASAIRTLEAAADEVHVLEHCALACGDDRTVFAAFAGWTLTGATYARKLWVQRINGSTGAISETYGVSTTDDSVSITGTEQVGLCAVYGACWTPENRFFVVADQKRAEDGSNAYVATEYVGKIWNFDGTDLTSYKEYQPYPENAPYCVYTGISYRSPGMLEIPVFYLWDEGTTNEYRTGLMQLSTNGNILDVTGFGYDTSDSVLTSECHPGGSCGFERNSARVGCYEVNRQEGVLTGGMVRPAQTWLTDGRDLHYYDTEHRNGIPRRVAVGGTIGAGTNHTYNCHGLSRLASGDLVSVAFEYQDLSGGGTDLRLRIQVREPQRGAIRYEIARDFDSGDETNEPFLPQPYRWTGGVDANGNGTETTKDDFPWCVLAVNGPKRIEVD